MAPSGGAICQPSGSSDMSAPCAPPLTAPFWGMALKRHPTARIMSTLLRYAWASEVADGMGTAPLPASSRREVFGFQPHWELCQSLVRSIIGTQHRVQVVCVCTIKGVPLLMTILADNRPTPPRVNLWRRSWCHRLHKPN